MYRATRPKERTRGEKGRFYGSTMWQGYFVEAVILLVGLAILAALTCLTMVFGILSGMATMQDLRQLAVAYVILGLGIPVCWVIERLIATRLRS